MRAFLVDDEALALSACSGCSPPSGGCKSPARATDPVEAVPAILETKPDILFLDIEMPGMTGFEMLSQLQPQPWVVFTTATTATRSPLRRELRRLSAKPIEAAQLKRALEKIERMRGAAAPLPRWRN